MQKTNIGVLFVKKSNVKLSATKISEAEDRLFAEWADRYEAFVTDGAVDGATYVRSPIKLLFVLKEVNDPDGESWDLREFLRDGGQGPTWNMVTRWVEGVQQLPASVPWSEISGWISPERRQEALRTIAVVNLKKTPGGASSEYFEIRDAVTRDHEFIRAQLELYGPDYVICCGSIVSEMLLGGGQRSTHRGVEYAFLEGTPYIAYHHPQARMPGNLLYYGLIDAIAELIGNERSS